MQVSTQIVRKFLCLQIVGMAIISFGKDLSIDMTISGSILVSKILFGTLALLVPILNKVITLCCQKHHLKSFLNMTCVSPLFVNFETVQKYLHFRLGYGPTLVATRSLRRYLSKLLLICFGFCGSSKSHFKKQALNSYFYNIESGI